MTADKCKFSCKVGACVAVTAPASSLVLRGGVVTQGFGAGVIVEGGARVHGINVTASENKTAG